MIEKKTVKIAAAKGRPMLTWVGKRPLAHVNAFPAQHVETFAPGGPAYKATGQTGPRPIRAAACSFTATTRKSCPKRRS